MASHLPQLCKSTWDLLEDFISGELPAESEHTVSRHLKDCPVCREERRCREEIRCSLRRSWMSQPVPAGLERRLRNTVLTKRSMPAVGYLRWAAAFALVAAALYLAALFVPLPFLTVDHFHQVALNHLHCQEIEKPDPEDMPASMRADLKALDAAMRQVEADAPLVSAHLCAYKGIQFIHLVFMNAERKFSLLLEERGSLQRLAAFDPSREGNVGAIPVRFFETDGVSLAAFRSGRHFVYLVLDEENPQRCIDLARTLFPPLSDSLSLL